MRGQADPQTSMFSYISLDERIPSSHPIRKIRQVVDVALDAMESDFQTLYSDNGRPSIPPERLLRAQMLQILFSIRSERQLVERIDYDMMFRWFVGMDLDEPVWNHSTFTKNRDRLLCTSIAQRLFEEINRQAYAKQLLSRDHFSVDGTLIDASASMKSFVPKAEQGKDESNGGSPPGGSGPTRRNEEVDFRGQKRSNKTHASTTDPDARLLRKSQGSASRRCMMGHILIENRSGMIVDAMVTEANTAKEWDAGLEMLDKLPIRPGQTVGGDRGYDVKRFVDGCRELNVTAHVAMRSANSAIDERTSSKAGYRISIIKRKRVEEPFGWMKNVGTIRKLLHRGIDKASAIFLLNSAMFNVTRMKTLM